ncbi:phosphoribosylformylglycinamidine cyclo-ligase [Lacticaseibacillus pantheris DSM 15945 = JCM 12539 = NBRC 106106]|uniref:Phosphoribosylformylglycinamidine cyclo-ligase n=1 Tax=Lacticaseibacillus pantheris DSM 15945 = JCM 12539 = NBRC 106106 TaxID=1423783 RepID=A0A0R1U083_9LACO|nr:phosphoribosylformylglycinamidine cyclo-ligase [Lacticaseibacillus pantheris]KRL86366.1 phosphoribosylformylglycinamidine cyclo-ligase [Lacticaseibacillus pantheris DSM 15945 = JCM 12539 = NBRC 106106]
MTDAYREAGVDITAGAAAVERFAPLAASTHNEHVVSKIGGFAAAYALPELSNPVVLAATDGVGTKVLLAQQHHQVAGLGTDLVAMVANDLLADGAYPQFFLDYMAVGHLDPELAAELVGGIASGCREAGMALIGGETAEMPDLYQGGHFDLAGFGVGVADRNRTLPRGVEAGDLLVGFPSTGVHANGFSLVRHLLDTTGLADQPLADGRTVVAALLTPTRIYVRSITPLIEAGYVHGLAHITGGGWTDNVPRMLPATLAAEIDVGSWAWPELFTRMQTAGELTLDEMRRTFNLGMGMVAALDPEHWSAIQAACPDAVRVGKVVPRAAGQAVVWREGVHE